jgi:addiction module HigA family antidote
MKPKPAHPGDYIYRHCIEPSGLTITEAAAALGVTRPGLSELLNGKRGISAEMAVRLEKFSGESAESWLARQGQYDLANVRRDRIRVKRPRPYQPG